jgi:TolA-binding protein
MGLNRRVLPAALIAAFLAVCSCASAPDGTHRFAELQAQMVELQKAQAGVIARMDEINHALLVLEEAVRLNKQEIERVSKTAVSPRVTIAAAPPQPAPKPPALPPTTSPPPDGPLAGQGGEFVAPPPSLDPGRVAPDRAAPPILPRRSVKAAIDGTFRVEPDPALLADAAFAGAWASHKPGGYALAIFAWNDVQSGAGGPGVVNAARYYQAEAYFQLGEYAQAISLFQGIPGNAQAGAYRAAAAYRLACCQEAAGRVADAVAQYRKVIEQFPGTDAAKRASGRLGQVESR